MNKKQLRKLAKDLADLENIDVQMSGIPISVRELAKFVLKYTKPVESTEIITAFGDNDTDFDSYAEGYRIGAKRAGLKK